MRTSVHDSRVPVKYRLPRGARHDPVKILHDNGYLAHPAVAAMPDRSRSRRRQGPHDLSSHDGRVRRVALPPDAPSGLGIVEGTLV